MRSDDEMVVVDDDEMNISPTVCNFSNSFSILFYFIYIMILFLERDGKK